MCWLQCPVDDVSVTGAWQGELHQQTQVLLLRGLNSNFICFTNVLQRVQFLLTLTQCPLQPVNVALDKCRGIRAHHFATLSVTSRWVTQPEAFAESGSAKPHARGLRLSALR